MQTALQESKNQLVRRWGELGGYWGINRTMAEIYALMFVSTEPLCTDDVMEQLHISRGNASMNLRALVDWGLIRRKHKFGQRREFFDADTDVWHMFETIMQERRRREVEPILETIDHCQALIAPLKEGADEHTDLDEFRKRLKDLRNFLDTMNAVFDLVLKYGGSGIEQFVSLVKNFDGPAAANGAHATNGGAKATNGTAKISKNPANKRKAARS
ncbi:MAG: GbsR/MarR family transcriptional regulator [Phycisphaerae bacterium]